jgi:hypothetical protein
MRRLSIIITLLFGVAILVTQAAPLQQANLYELFILQARNDLELLADGALGEGARPDSWTFNFDLSSDVFVADLWYDNEMLAEHIYGAGVRPDEWFGATTLDPYLLSRNIRHDLEMAAQHLFENERPIGWNGAEPIYQCDRTTQNLIRYIEMLYDARPTVDPTVPNYCDLVEFEIESDLIRVSLAPIQGLDFGSLQEKIVSTRGDLERTANEVLGVSIRPEAWIGYDEESLSFVQDLNTDIEALANIIYQGAQRPDIWGRNIPDSAAISFFNMRYNLETMTSEALGDGERPYNWEGVSDTLYRCEPMNQALIQIMIDLFGYRPDREIGERTTAQFCRDNILTANNYADNPPTTELGELIDDPRDRVFSGEAEYAWAFLDVGALDYMGMMPEGTRFRAWYRNFQDSTMMYVTGLDQDFGVYIDRRFTSLDSDVFRRLPTLDGVRPVTYCNAYWCNGPGPTPTPRGGSAVERLVQGSGTAVPETTVIEEIREETGKLQVSWNHIRVTYLLDRQENRSVQVVLEICYETQQIRCEPVSGVLDQTMGVYKPVVGLYNGLNIFEMPYGYSTNVIVESANIISPDVWISDPTLR